MIIYIFHIRFFAKIIKIILKPSATVEYLNKSNAPSFQWDLRHRHLYNKYVFLPWAIFL